MVRAAAVGVPITHRDRLPSSSRYELLVKIASGGMATVYVGRLSSAVGTKRLVAIKRAHAHLLEDPAFGRMLIAEAKLASRIHHPNVVAVQSVEEADGELLLVMDYVEGASLADLAADDVIPIPGRVAVRALLDACAGLQAAHELVDDDGKPLGIVHRDVSPHNILVGVDGVSRLTDFGIAKSTGHTGSAGRTSTGALKGKIAYMAPEYIDAGQVDARSDVFSLGIVAWESLTRARLFRGATDMESLRLVLATAVPKPSEIAPWLGRALDKVILKALARAPEDRFATASELGEALEIAARRDDLIATANQVGTHVRAAAGEALALRRTLLRERPASEGSPSTPEDLPELVGRPVDSPTLSVEVPPAATPSLEHVDTAPLSLTENTASMAVGSIVRPRMITARMTRASFAEPDPPSTEPASSERPRASRARGRVRLERAVLLAVVAAVLVGFGALGVVRSLRADPSATARTGAAPLALPVPVVANANATANANASASPPMMPPPMSSGTVSAPAPDVAPAVARGSAPSAGNVTAGGAKASKPRVVVPVGSSHPPPPTTASPYGEPTPTVPAATVDRAPPNPYGK